MIPRRLFPKFSLCSIALVLLITVTGSIAFGQGYGAYLPPNHINPHGLSQGAKAWWFGPNLSGMNNLPVLPALTGSNVDAANPNEDLAPGQSETAIAASGNLVMEAWNDATTFFIFPSTDRQASGTGVGFSRDGGNTFRDLRGLPNSNPNQKWAGDPSVVAVDGGRFFIVGSIYASVFPVDCSKGPSENAIAVSVATVTPNGVLFTNPIVVASGGDACSFPGQTAFLDKDFMSYDPTTRTLAVTYDRFSFFGFGTGQPEVVTVQIPQSPPFLSSANFSAPVVIWPEEPSYENEGTYPALAYNASTGTDDIYVAWERNWFTNQFNGDPYVYIQAAVIPLGAFTPLVGGPSSPVVVTLNQLNSNVYGGVKSLDLVPVPGYSRGTSNDFPRIAWDAVKQRVLIVWNDASHHPLGDIFMRAFGTRFSSTGAILKVNDDNTGALHMFPAVCVRTDGNIATSWYDRRNYPPDSAMTDYFGEIRSAPNVNGVDFQITTAPTDWANTSSIINPNFGDYTDNACTGTTTLFTWSDGRMGVPQPFVAHNP